MAVFVVAADVVERHDWRKLTFLRLVSPDGTTHGSWKRAFTTAAHGSDSTFNRYLKHLVDNGFVEHDETVDPAVYRLTAQGKEATRATSVNEVSEQN